MEITREILLAEQAAYEQQLAQHRQSLEKAARDIEAVNGGLQVVGHLLRKLEEQPANSENKGDDNS